MKLLVNLLVLGIVLYCQNIYTQYQISGTITTSSGAPVSDASVYIKNSNNGTVSNSHGTYALELQSDKDIVLIVSNLGFVTQEKKITIEQVSTVVDFALEEDVAHLNEVTIAGKSKAQLLRETVYKPEVINVESLQIKSTPVADIIGQISGVKVRQQGGLGSEANVMINGISGKGIRTFIDGIPVDYLGDSFELRNMSSDMIKSIEIYKNVIPVSFGSDILGGVVNIVTKNRYQNYIEASYSYGSWNTHLGNISVKRRLGKKGNQFLQADAVINHSDNSYWMEEIEVPIDELNNTAIGRAKRFHDTYTSTFGRVQYGTENVSWADDFRVGISVSEINKEFQHGISAITPWGGVENTNTSYNGLLSWKKKIWKDRLTSDVILGINKVKEQFIDTLARTYYWDGSYVPKSTRGESGLYVNGRTPELDRDNVFARLGMNYELHENHQVNLTSLISYEEVSGEDKAGAATFTQDIFKTPQELTKVFTGISLESTFLDGKITNNISAKYYYGKSFAVSLKEDNTLDQFIKSKQETLGYGNVLKYEITPAFTGFLGYEYAIRIPDSEEIFGDGLIIGPNANLKMEQSHNANAGIQWKGMEDKVQLSVNGFFRKTENQIFLNAISSGISAYLNLFNTKTIGVEGTFTLFPIKNTSVYANLTWQKVTLNGVDDYGIVESRHIGSRIPNTPYLFGNLGADYQFRHAFQKNDAFHISYQNNFVEEFFLSWENDGLDETKAIIPRQFVHNASIGYTFPEKKYSLSLECRNVSDELVYDNYKVQKPGRSFYVKFRVFLQ
ncbi:TonB-dependent receptor domain-containing protein [Aquimarina hainanensis]|uniref:TonB-dependent receptor domain-containing protein n=1 Tax=Aquimarina hainanensis TaxID=1578017 RepID=A0ABW5N5Y6_9FLAO